MKYEHWQNVEMLLKILILGVWVVGNVGREKGSIGWPLLAAYLSSPLYIFYNFGFSIVTLSSMYYF